MSRSSTILLVLTALIAAVVYVELRLPGPTPPSGSTDDPRLRDWDARLEALESAERARNSPDMPGSDGRSVLVEKPDIAAAPADGDPEAGTPEADPDTPAKDDPKAGLHASIREILADAKSGGLDRDRLNDLWNTLAGSGLEDEAIKAYRAYVKANPQDADGRYALGIALTQKLRGGTVSQLEMGTLAMRADAEFSKALEIDDRHIEARFSKAFSYTFWPPAAGKGPEAIKHFEILVERHGTDTENGIMPQVWFNLGDQYRKAGNFDKAKDAFRRGLAVFPESEMIRKALETMD